LLVAFQEVFCQLSAANSSPLDHDKSIQEIINSIRTKHKVVGVQFCIIDSLGILNSWTSGYTDNRKKVPISDKAILRIGSTTKLFTSYLIMKLVQDSLLNLTDKLLIWYPDFPNADQISVRNLLMHKSGVMEILRYPRFLFLGMFQPERKFCLGELISYISEHSRKKAESPNVNKYEYSNTNFLLLGAIAERVYKKDFSSLVNDISNEMALEHIYYIIPNSSNNALIIGYDKDLIPFPWGYRNRINNTSWTSLAATAGGIISNAEDLCSFFANYVRGNSFIDSIKKSIFSFEPCTHEGSPEITGIGLGVFQMKIDGTEYWGHEGQMIGSESLVMYCPMSKSTFCVTGNRSAFKGKYEIISKVQGLLMK
jgi:D-alanyl-D-alanine carboxypeptidase